MTAEIRQLIQQATNAFEAGNYDEAEALLLRVVDRTPTYANVHNMLGFIASQRNAGEQAVTLFRRALSLNPDYTEARLNLVLTLTGMGAYEQAAQEAARLESPEAAGPQRLSLGVRGKLANAHADLGRKYHDLGLYAEAIAEYDKALLLCPTFPDLHNRRAVSCRELGLYAEAKTSLLRALELKPNYVEAHVNLGVLHQKLGNLTDAVKTWERALQLDPKHRLARIYLKQATASGTTAR
ncbi:MAG: tetratricopeptide repeat protein [candidate division NC10 bacterium]|nr:tetratricopeptide repeat protein [candidate division NC10 bacterium]